MAFPYDPMHPIHPIYVAESPQQMPFRRVFSQQENASFSVSPEERLSLITDVHRPGQSNVASQKRKHNHKHSSNTHTNTATINPSTNGDHHSHNHNHKHNRHVKESHKDDYGFKDETESEDQPETKADAATLKSAKKNANANAKIQRSDSQSDEVQSVGDDPSQMQSELKQKTRRKPRVWSALEDDRLRQAVLQLGGQQWKRIAKAVGTGRTAEQCCQRWVRVLSPDIRKGAWTEEEDQHLLQRVEQVGEGLWKDVAVAIPGRTDQQCRYRWIHLQKAIAKRDIDTSALLSIHSQQNHSQQIRSSQPQPQPQPQSNSQSDMPFAPMHTYTALQHSPASTASESTESIPIVSAPVSIGQPRYSTLALLSAALAAPPLPRNTNEHPYTLSYTRSDANTHIHPVQNNHQSPPQSLQQKAPLNRSSIQFLLN